MIHLAREGDGFRSTHGVGPDFVDAFTGEEVVLILGRKMVLDLPVPKKRASWGHWEPLRKTRRRAYPSKPPKPRPPVRHTLYRWFAGEDLLYIGISGRAYERACAHARSSEWFTEADRMTVEHFDSSEELRDAERAAIQEEHPQYNIVYNNTGGPT
jgi:hypothetical protein